jgi:Secretion system C-terminal sorting domain
MKKIYFTLSFLVLSASLIAQTIPNGSFENWSNTQGYADPDDWTTLNFLSFFSGLDLGATQESPGAVGSSYCRLTCTADADGLPSPSFAITGQVNFFTGQGNTGFPVNNIPDFLSGQYRSLINGDDLAGVVCFFTRWNQAAGVSDTLAVGSAEYTQTQSTWSNFDIPIVPLMTGTPDTCLILIIAGGGNAPEIGNYFDVDDLHFTGGVSSIDEQTNSMFSIYPNPMNDLLMIDLSTMENSNDVSLFDTQGRLLEKWQLGATRTTLNVAHLPAGSYIMHVSNRRGRWTQSLIKN